VLGVRGTAVAVRGDRGPEPTSESRRAVLFQAVGRYVAPFGKFTVREADVAFLLGVE